MKYDLPQTTQFRTDCERYQLLVTKNGRSSAEDTELATLATTLADYMIKASDWNTVESHLANVSNPHNVTTTQIGAETPSGAQAKVDTHAALTNIHGATSSATASRIVFRDTNGRSQVASPSVGSDIVNKTYADLLVATIVLSGTNVNTLINDGRHYISSPVNAPDGVTAIYLDVIRYSATYVTQTAKARDDNRVWTRNLVNGTWSSWSPLHTPTMTPIQETNYFSPSDPNNMYFSNTDNQQLYGAGTFYFPYDGIYTITAVVACSTGAAQSGYAAFHYGYADGISNGSVQSPFSTAHTNEFTITINTGKVLEGMQCKVSLRTTSGSQSYNMRNVRIWGGLR